MTVQDINNEGRNLFGADYDFETEVGTIARYTEEQKLIGEEMDRFFDSLPNWVEEGDQFWLYMQPEAEREAWLKANAPKPVKIEDSPYFSRTIGYRNNAPAVKVGGITIR